MIRLNKLNASKINVIDANNKTDHDNHLLTKKNEEKERSELKNFLLIIFIIPLAYFSSLQLRST